jgi:uncharacterized protein (TIGR02147 family)
LEIVNFPNYRSLIRSFLERRAPKGRGEILKLAEFMGVHPTFVSQVLAGKKDFNMEQSFAVAEYLELTPVERKYFLLLVQKDRAGSKKLKDYLNQELADLRRSLLPIANQLKEHRSLTDEEKAVFYSSWKFSAIRLYCSLGSGKTLEEICEYFRLSRQRALEILEFLVAKNLLLNSKGVYSLGSQHTHLPGDSPHIVRHHMNWRMRALQRHDSVTQEELAFTAPVSISKKDFLAIREKVLACIKESIEVAKNSDAEEVAFLNIDWLWLNENN